VIEFFPKLNPKTLFFKRYWSQHVVMYRRLMKATAFFFLGIKLARLELKKKKTKAGWRKPFIFFLPGNKGHHPQNGKGGAS
jgi:hypothetical protein